MSSKQRSTLLVSSLISAWISACLLFLASCTSTPSRTEAENNSCDPTCAGPVYYPWLSAGWYWGPLPYYSYYYPYYTYYPYVVTTSPPGTPPPATSPMTIPGSNSDIAAYNSPYVGQGGQAALNWGQAQTPPDDAAKRAAIADVPSANTPSDWGAPIAHEPPPPPAPAAEAPAASAPAAGQAMPGGGWGPSK